MNKMDGTNYTIQWTDDNGVNEHQIICESRSDDIIEENNDIEEDEEYLVGEEIIPSTEIITLSNSLDQIAAENLIYMAQDGSVAVMSDLIEEQVEQVDNADYNEQQYFECQVTEEVITDDWVQQQGEDRVEVPVDQLVGEAQNDEETVPLPTDEYTTSRPYPCDFCSRRFRKKANLVNHMVAHKNDRPHVCNLCGARYTHKQDLLSHLKIHAQMPDSDLEYVDLLMRNDKIKGNESNDESMALLEDPLAGRKTTRQQRRGARAQASPASKKKKAALKASPASQRDKYADEMENLMGAAQEHEAYYESQNQSTSAIRYTVTDPGRPFVCQTCGLSFAREKALLSHTIAHGTTSSFECDSCNDIFWSFEQLQEHQSTQHPTEDVTSGSEYGPDKDQLSEEESDSKFGDYYCNVCGMSFHRIDLLRRHSRTHSQPEAAAVDNTESHCCNVCGSTFAEALDLLAHAEIHTRVTSFKCTLCGEQFMQDQSIRQHIVTVHAKEITEHTCRLCGKHCKDERSLLKHAWDHSKEKNHSCMKCGKTFFNKARLKRHMQSHRNKSVLCNICGESFPDGRSLMNHRHSHTNVSGRQFPCRECGKTFGSRSSQQIHMRIHTGERPYGCRFCWKAFADGGTLRKHERIHTGEKPYACPVCPRAFNQRVVLREHIRSHHSGVDPSYEHTLTPYHCTVCGKTFKTPTEIIQHLIGHSDENTISKRQPTVGPRKYKRRRKLKPDELERLRREESLTESPAGKRDTRKRQISEKEDTRSNDTFDESESYSKYNEYSYASVSSTSLRSRERTAAPSSAARSKSDKQRERLDAAIESIDNTLNDIAPDAMSSSSRRLASRSPAKKGRASAASTANTAMSEQKSLAKMIHTKKKVVAPKDGRGKAKTLVTTRQASILSPPSPQPPPVSERTSARNRSSAKKQTRSSAKAISNGIADRDYDNDPEFEMNKVRLELSKKSLKYNPDVVSDLEEILRSPTSKRDRSSLSQSEQYGTVACDLDNLFESPVESTKPNTRSSRRLNNRNLIRELNQADAERHQTPNKSLRSAAMNLFHKDDNIIPMPAINIKQEKEVSFTLIDEPEVFTCEMCSAIFHDRAQLLVHVPIHI